MYRLLAVFCLWIIALPSLHAQTSFTQRVYWKAGVARVKITPTQPMWMSGYASRTKPAEGKLHDLWAKALVLEDTEGKRHVLVTLDLVGIPRDLSAPVCAQLQNDFGLTRDAIILSTSHTHTGPVVRSNLRSMYKLGEKQQKFLDEYGDALERRIILAVEKAMKNLAPAKLSWAIGEAKFAVNRRNNKEKDVPQLRAAGKLKGPVDHEVPVLAVRNLKDQLRAVVFGYACHATVLSFYKWSGDYPGFAQIALEKRHPGAIAMFWAGCGGDQNPLPRRKVSLAEKYGNQLADAVDAVLAKKMHLVRNPIRSTYREIDLPFSELPTREKLVEDMRSKNRYVAARAKLLLAQLKKEGRLRGTYPYPVQIWQVGKDLTWIALGGEVVVDYALRLKKEIGPSNTWVMAYANDVMAYIPSLRVLKEGGYEGGGAMVYYGLPTVWSPQVERRIVAEVHRQADVLRRAKKSR